MNATSFAATSRSVAGPDDQRISRRTVKSIVALFAREVSRDEIAVGAAKVVDVVGEILPDVDLPVR